MKAITFQRSGKIIQGYVLAADSDPSCAMWVVDAVNPDVDYMVLPSEVVR